MGVLNLYCIPLVPIVHTNQVIKRSSTVYVTVTPNAKLLANSLKACY